MAKVYNLESFAIKTTVAYLLLSIAWILSSDYVLAELTPYFPAKSLASVSALKGIAFVLVTGLLLYGLLSRLTTQLRATEHSWKVSDKTYQDLFDANPTPALVVDNERLTIVRANPAAYQLYGYDDRGLNGKSLNQLTYKQCDDLPAEKALTNEPVCHVHRDGSRLFVRIQTLPASFETRRASMLLLNDETQWRKAGKERRKALHHLETSQRIGQLGHWEYDRANHQVYLSKGAARIFDLAEVEEKTIGLKSLLRPFDEKDQSALIELFRKKNTSKAFEHHLRVGQERHGKRDILVRGEYLDDETGECLWVGSCVDLTDRYRAEARLEERERQYRKLVEILPDAVLVCQENIIIFANPAAAAIFGAASSQQLEGLSIIELIAEETHGSYSGVVYPSPVVDGVKRISRLTLKTLDGSVFDGQLAARHVELEGQSCVQILISDVSEREKIKRALEVANQGLIDLANRTVTDLELERKVIAQALHDEIGQSLTAIKLSAGWLKRHSKDPQALEKIGNVMAISSDAIEKVRDLSLMLRPPQLEELGLVAAIRWQAARLLDEADLKWSVKADESVSGLEPPLDIVAFRVIQEALTNIIRHSRASAVRIELRVSRTHLSIEVRDDGIGFDIDQETATLGLAFMEERVQIAGGRLNLQSSREGGTHIRVRLPLTRSEVAVS